MKFKLVMKRFTKTKKNEKEKGAKAKGDEQRQRPKENQDSDRGQNKRENVRKTFSNLTAGSWQREPLKVCDALKPLRPPHSPSLC